MKRTCLLGSAKSKIMIVFNSYCDKYIFVLIIAKMPFFILKYYMIDFD